jgi:hypothetical protein
MAEHRSRAASQNGCHPLSLDAQAAVSDRVDTTMDAVQPAGVDPFADPTWTKSAFMQLRRGDRSVLTGRDRRNGRLYAMAVEKLAYMDNNPPGRFCAPGTGVPYPAKSR